MKKLLVAILALGSLSAFAGECKMHFDYHSMEGFPSASRLSSKIAKEVKKLDRDVVKNVRDANIGVKLRYTFIQLKDVTVDNGPYPTTTYSNLKTGVRALVYKNGKMVRVFEYKTTETDVIAVQLLNDLDC